jgi:unsaturated chondroitin disaccharide hydrolase
MIELMMNVPLVIYTASETHDQALREIARAHCRTTRKRLVRADGSTAQEGVFDAGTGEFLRQSTQQGLRSDSCWAQGLAWSMYGFSKVHALTGSQSALQTSELNASYWLANLPADRVPCWDFDADPQAPLPQGSQKDSTAAAIAASALLDLAKQTQAPDRSKAYRNAALEMLDVLVGPDYLAQGDADCEGILRHGVYHLPKRLGIDESTLWGDYFLVEGLMKALAQL